MIAKWANVVDAKCCCGVQYIYLYEHDNIIDFNNAMKKPTVALNLGKAVHEKSQTSRVNT